MAKVVQNSPHLRVFWQDPTGTYPDPFETSTYPHIPLLLFRPSSRCYVFKVVSFLQVCKLIFEGISHLSDRLCDLVVRVPGYRSRGPGSIPDATRFSEK
jgi:hypothetical protein